MPSKQSFDDMDREELVAYLDGELDEPAARELEAKLSLDAEARQEADALRKTWDLLDYLPRPEPSPDFTHQTIARLRPQSTMAAPVARDSRRPWLSNAGWAAAVLLAGLAGFASTRYFLQRRQADRQHKQLVRDLRVVDQVRVYESVDDIDFLHKLANPNDPDLFGEERPGALGD